MQEFVKCISAQSDLVCCATALKF